MRLYLAGPIYGCTDEECRDWREWVKSRWPGETLDPMRRDYRGHEDLECHAIVEGDKADINICDALLVNYTKPSAGTTMEMLYAWERGKVVVVVTPSGERVSPWVRYHAWDVVGSLEDAVRVLDIYRIYGPCVCPPRGAWHSDCRMHGIDRQWAGGETQ